MLVSIICCQGNPIKDGLDNIVNPHNSTCYDDIKNHAGYVLPVRSLKQN